MNAKTEDLDQNSTESDGWRWPWRLEIDPKTWKPKLTPKQVQSLVWWQVGDTIDISREDAFEKELFEKFSHLVIGQDDACRAIAESISTWIFNPYRKKWNLWVLFFAGPTWVGKTESVRAVSQVLLWDDKAFIPIRWEELQDKNFGISKLLGAWDGYVWFWKKWHFHEIWADYKKAKERWDLHRYLFQLPDFSILLIDEVEKAHPKVHQALLGIMDEWRVKVSTNKSKSAWANQYVDEWIDLSNTLIILTSNLAQSEIQDLNHRTPIWFARNHSIDEHEKDSIFDRVLQKTFSPEFLGRIWTVVQFWKLSKEDCKAIVDVHMQSLNEYIQKYFLEGNYHISMSDAVYDAIISEWYNEKKGARPLVRTIEKRVYAPLWKLIKSQDFSERYGSTRNPVIIHFDTSEDTKDLTFQVHNPQIVDENEVLPVEEEKESWTEDFSELLLDNLARSLGTISKVWATIDRFEEDGFSREEFDILEGLDPTIIEEKLFEIDNELFEVKWKDSQVKDLYEAHSKSFTIERNGTNVYLLPRILKNKIASWAALISSWNDYSKHLFILKVISHSFLTIKRALWLEAFSQEQSDFIITISIIEALRLSEKHYK